MSNLTTHELDSPPWLRVESTLMATARLVRVAFDTRLAPLDLNLTQASLIGYVNEFGASTQTDLADHLGIGRAAIGSVIDRLQARGLVERQPLAWVMTRLQQNLATAIAATPAPTPTTPPVR